MQLRKVYSTMPPPPPPVEGVPVAPVVRAAAGVWTRVARRRAELRRDQGELEATWLSLIHI